MTALLMLLGCPVDPITVPDGDDTASNPDNQLPFVVFSGGDQVVETGAQVLLNATVGDPDSGPDQLTLEWSSDQQGVLEGGTLQGGSAVMRVVLDPGEHLVTLTATDPDGALSWDTKVVRVNRGPSSPVVSITPEAPEVGERLVVVVDVESEDPDGDVVEYNYAWSLDGEVQGYWTGAAIPADETNGGETWSVAVTATDGVSTSDPATASVTIANRPPGAPEVVISPTTLAAGMQTAQCVLVTEAEDLDHQELGYEVTWYGDGKRYPDLFDAVGPETTTWYDDTLPAVDTDLAKEWECRMRAYDGFDRGEPGVASAKVVGWDALGNVEVFDESQVIKGGYVIATPVTLKEDATVVALGMHTVTSGVQVRMALYTDKSGPQDLALKTKKVTLVEGENVFEVDQTELTAGTWWVAFQLMSDTEVPYNKYTAPLSVYEPASGALPDPMRENDLSGQVNAWLVVKDE